MTPTATTTWYLATCLDCEPVLPMPFYSASDRDEWVAAHRATGHAVLPTQEAR